jgi:hypothetical protein
MIARYESDRRQIIAEAKEQERGVENSHQHGAKISGMQQKSGAGPMNLNKVDLRFVGAV